MAIASPGPNTAPKRFASARLRLLTSSIGLKLVMAATGVILSGFVLGHMVGNLKVFEGAEALNAYGRLLRVEPPLLWTVRLVLLGSVALHIGAWLLLTKVNLKSRPQGYRLTSYKESTYASRTMRYTGPLLLAFIVYHLLHLTTGTVHPSYVDGDVYHNVVSGLHVTWVALFYLVAMAALGFHLWHGVVSLFQTLGLENASPGSFTNKIAAAFTLVVVLGFAAVPLSVLAGLVK